MCSQGNTDLTGLGGEHSVHTWPKALKKADTLTLSSSLQISTLPSDLKRTQEVQVDAQADARTQVKCVPEMSREKEVEGDKAAKPQVKVSQQCSQQTLRVDERTRTFETNDSASTALNAPTANECAQTLVAAASALSSARDAHIHSVVERRILAPPLPYAQRRRASFRAQASSSASVHSSSSSSSRKRSAREAGVRARDNVHEHELELGREEESGGAPPPEHCGNTGNKISLMDTNYLLLGGLRFPLRRLTGSAWALDTATSLHSPADCSAAVAPISQMEREQTEVEHNA